MLKKVTVPDSYIRLGSSSDHNTDEDVQNEDEIEENEDLEDELEDEEEIEEIIEVWDHRFYFYFMVKVYLAKSLKK